ncbi:hypothetical protein ABES02_25270 [Neobacillus pocheonensis]|uniref:hypothetical protein n=1 Tax=Neobacillus pocheonensis TaxID=363869 RepID=UPI003D2AA62F
MIDFADLDYLFSRKALDKLSKNPKKIYKNYLALIFTAALNKTTLIERLDKYRGIQTSCYDLLNNPKEYTEQSLVESTGKLFRGELNANYIKNPNVDSTIDSIISFMREMIKSRINGERYLISLKELEKMMSVKQYLSNYYSNSYDNLEHHHWIEFDMEKGLVHTFPEFITYAYLVSIWNIYLQKRKCLIEAREDQRHILSQDIVFPSDIRIKVRTIESEMQALINSLSVQCITFTESYLYYVYYNVKEGNFKLQSDIAKKFIKKSEQPNDEDIIDNLIKPEFLQALETEEEKLLNLYAGFKKINRKRNRLIHASAFENEKKSHLIPLISMGSEELVDTLDLCVQFVLEVEKILPQSLKLLFWWGTMKHPNFKEYEEGNYVTRRDI